MRDPYSLEAEHGVLGAMMMRPDLIADISAELTASDFYFEDHGDIFKAIVSLDDGKTGIDIISVAEKIGSLENGDSPLSYLGQIHRNTPSAANAMTYCRIVKERSLDRMLLGVAQKVNELAYSDLPAVDKIAQSQAAVLAVDGDLEDDGEVELSDYLRDYVEVQQRRHDMKGMLNGLSTGLKELDEAVMGIRGGQLVVIAGRAKMGKTTFAMNMVRHNIIREGKKGAVISLEMSRTELTDRMVAAEGSIPMGKIKSGEAASEYGAEMTGALALLNKAKVRILDRPGWTMSKIRTWARKRKRRYGLDFLVIDHLGLLQAEVAGHTALQRTSDATMNAKLLAKELDIPVILLCQLNRALEQRTDKRPMPSDLRDSGTIEQDADMVLFVYRDDYYHKDSPHKGIAEIIIGIARDIECKTIYAAYDGQYNRFRDLAPGSLPEPRQEQPKQKGRGMSF